MLLWIAGGAIAAVGAAWLVITQPWTSSDVDAPEIAFARAPTPSAEASPALTTEVEAAVGDASALAPDATLDNPLRMAELAYDAGMLIEPEEYSAWTLYSRVLKTEPDNTAARDGLTKVADDLVRRGETALDQGRFDDARATVERIRVRPARPRRRQSAGAEDLPEVGPRRSRACRVVDRQSPRCRAWRASRRPRRRRRSRKSTPSSKPARRSTRRWPKAGS